MTEKTNKTVDTGSFYAALGLTLLVSPAVLFAMATIGVAINAVFSGPDAADVGSVLIVTTLSFSIGSTILGSPVFLTIGVAVLWQCAKHGRAHPVVCALAGLVTNTVLFGGWGLLITDLGGLAGLLFYFGTFFAPF